MKNCLVISVLLLLTSLPSFTSANPVSHGQPSRSSQFGVNRSHLSHNASSKILAHPHGIPITQPSDHWRSISEMSEKQMAGKKTRNLARTGCAASRARKFGSSCPSSASFVAAARTPWAGTDDGETQSVIGDFNGDGKMDVARIVTNTSGVNEITQLSVLLGNGDGTFQSAQLTTIADIDGPILVGDLNGDGKDDILLVQGTSFFVWISNGDGTFTVSNSGNAYPVSEAGLMGGLLTDLNGDGKLDVLAFDSATPGNVVELLGNGDGTFQAATTLGALTAGAPGGMVFADFNGDGKLDFAGFSQTGQIQVTLATGTGLFANAPVSLVTEDATYHGCSLAAGDLTGDGKPEIVSVNCNPQADTVTVYVNNADGSFQKGIHFNSNFNKGNFPSAAAIADVNGDGKNDVVLTNPATGNISVLFGHGDGTLDAEAPSYDTGGNPGEPALIADFNGDGLPDVALSDGSFNMVYLQGYGDGSFRAAPTYELPKSFGQFPTTFSVATGDFNGDGIPDVVIGQSANFGSTGVAVYLGKGDGTFHPGINYGGGDPFLQNVVVADFNGDGKLDIAATDNTDNIVQILIGNGDGTFSPGAFYPTDSNSNPGPTDIVAGDFNHDGKIDLAIANANTNTIGVLLGNGDGTFGNFVSYPLPGQSPGSLAAVDLNGDGYLDLEAGVFNGDFPQVAILLGKSDNSGAFNAAVFIDINGIPTQLAFGDLNKDGKVDMAVTESEGITFNGQIEILLGKGDGTFNAPTAFASSTFGDASANTFPASIQTIDMNGDGNLDLVYLLGNYGTLAVASGNGDGTINAPIEFPTSTFTFGLALVDVNGDGAVDALVGNDQSGGFSVLLNGSGTGAAGNYSLGTQTPSQTVTSGSSATYTLDLAGSNGYNGTITFSCSNLPTGATCSFSPSSVLAKGDVPINTTMTIATTASVAQMLKPARPGAKPGSPMLLASLSGLGLFGLMLAGSGRKGRQRRASILLGMMLLLTMVTVVGCDSDSTKKATGTSAGAYVVTVTSTGTGTAAPTHSLNLTLIVQ